MSVVAQHTAGGRRWRIGIGGRLTLGFICIVGLAISACLVGWLVFHRVERDLRSFVSSQVPQLAFTARLSAAGSDLASAAASLTRAADRNDYGDRRGVYVAALEQMEELQDAIGGALDGILPAASPELARATLAAIDIAAGKRFTLQEVMQSDLEQLRWMQADLIDEVGPLVEDIRFNIEIAMRHGRPAEALVEQARIEALLSMMAEANLSTGLLSRVVSARLPEELLEAEAFLSDSRDELTRQTQALSDWPDAATARQLGDGIAAHADSLSGIANRKRTELLETARLDGLAAENGRIIAELGAAVERVVSSIEIRAGGLADRAGAILGSGRWLMVLIAAAAVLSAMAIGHFYVGASLVRRIGALGAKAGTLSEGGAGIPDRGRDELEDLSRALDLLSLTQAELIQAAKLAALGQMAAGIGHELNQPLAAMRAHLHSAKRLTEMGDHAKAHTNIAKAEGLVGRMSGQIAHIRRFARRPMAELAVVDLVAVTRDAVALVDHRFESESVALHLDLPETSTIPVLAEAVRLEQVIVNLLTNALDAVEGRERRRVSIAIDLEGAKADLTVGDSGPGMAPETWDRIFDPFFTTKAPGAGLGLGLSISFNILRDFGGLLQVARSDARGTVMRIQMKVAP